jgi:murein DD-endopeptidase MepM/ murein hydrolase activator NlpD
MSKKIYHFNPQTLTFEKVYHSIGHRIWTILRLLIIGIGIAVIFLVFYFNFFNSPYERQLKKENKLLLTKYEILSRRIVENEKILDELQQRDDQLYRAIFNAEPIPKSIRRPGFGGTNRYESLMDLPNSELIISTTRQLDIMSKELYVQSKSYDNFIELIKTKDERMKNIPAIRPISGRDLKKQILSGFGMRLHPIYGDIRMHTGIDLNADAGTPIYATGNGIVESARYDGGYGYCVVVDHKFGYKSVYGHCKTMLVRPGQQVARGEKIATVGMTGDATGNHVHYEVRVKGKADNPAKYFFMDLTPEEYDEMLYVSDNR